MSVIVFVKETSVHLQGSWLALIVYCQINFGVIWHLVSSSYLIDNQKCRNFALKITPIISSVHVDD